MENGTDSSLAWLSALKGDFGKNQSFNEIYLVLLRPTTSQLCFMWERRTCNGK
jgi:hypothetical protein